MCPINCLLIYRNKIMITVNYNGLTGCMNKKHNTDTTDIWDTKRAIRKPVKWTIKTSPTLQLYSTSLLCSFLIKERDTYTKDTIFIVNLEDDWDAEIFPKITNLSTSLWHYWCLHAAYLSLFKYRSVQKTFKGAISLFPHFMIRMIIEFVLNII